MRQFFFLFTFSLTLTMTSCQQGSLEKREKELQRPYLIGQTPQNVSTYAQTLLENSTIPKTPDARLRKMELKTQKEIERIRAQKELAIAKLEMETKKQEIETNKEMTLKKIQTRLEKIVGDRKMVGWTMVLSALFLFLFLWVVTKLFKEYQLHKLKLVQERIRHEKEIKEKELQTRLAEKMFEALSNGHLNEEQKNRLLETLHDNQRHLPMKKEEPN